MPLRFTHRILEHLAHTNYEPATVKAEFVRCKSIADWHEVIAQKYAFSV